MDVVVNSDGTLTDKAANINIDLQMIYRSNGRVVDKKEMWDTIATVVQTMSTHELQIIWLLAAGMLQGSDAGEKFNLEDPDKWNSFIMGLMCGRMIGKFEVKTDVALSTIIEPGKAYEDEAFG